MNGIASAFALMKCGELLRAFAHHHLVRDRVAPINRFGLAHHGHRGRDKRGYSPILERE